MPETRSTRSKGGSNRNTSKRKTTKRKAQEEYEEDEEHYEDEEVEEEEQIDDDEDEEEVEEEEEERVVKRGKKSPAKPTPKLGAKRKAVAQKEAPASKKGRRNPTSYQDPDDEDLEDIQERFEEEQLNLFASAFGHLLNDKAYADVVVRVKHDNHAENEARGKIYAHKMLLALHSKVLKSMIDSSKEMLDGCTVISLDDEDMSYDVAYSLLEFIYRGSPQIPTLIGNAKNIIPVEKAVEKYLEPQFLACFQAHFMAPENIVSYYESAEFHKNKELAVKTRKIIYECAHGVSLRNVSVNTLKTLLADDEFDIEEAPLFEKIVDWAHGIIEKERGKPIKPIKHLEDMVYQDDDEEPDTEIFTDQNIIAARVKLLSPLLPLIRFGRMSAEDFFRRVDKYNVLDEDELIELYPLVMKAYTPRANDPRCQERGDSSVGWLRSKHLKAIKKMLPQAKPQLKQVFHAKTDQLTTFWSHSRVSPLLAVFKTTEGRIFGFYTSYKWAPNGRSKYANKTDLFMFSLGKGRRRSEFKKVEATNKRNGIPIYDYMHAGYLQLGHGHEMNLTFQNGHCTSQLHYCQGAADTYVMGGSHQFTVDDAICFRVQ